MRPMRRFSEQVRDNQSQAAPYVLHGLTETEKLREAAADAILSRANVAPIRAESLRGNPFASDDLVGIARNCLERAGVKTEGVDRMQMVAQAFTQGTSDFPNLLVNTMRKAALRGYDSAPESFCAW